MASFPNNVRPNNKLENDCSSLTCTDLSNLWHTLKEIDFLFDLETCNCNKKFYTNYWLNPPYMAKGESSNVSGIFPPILRLVVRSCCGDCKQHGYTEIDFLYSGHNSAAKKSTEKQVREAIDDAKELSFPVSGRMEQLDYSNEYGFAPLVQSAGVSFIVAGDEPGATAKMVVKAVLNLWPLIVTVFISAFFSGIVMWLMVSVV